MTDQWTNRLSEYVDGELSTQEARALEQHLEACFECRRLVSELRAVVARAAALPEREPANDLWAGIAARLEKTSPLQVHSAAPVRAPRRFAFSALQLAAASAGLMLLSGSLVWVLLGRPGGTTLAGAPAPAVRTVGTGAAAAQLKPYAGAVNELEAVLENNRSRLDPVTIAVLEENLRAIDAAITEARGALERDPGNLYLNQHLENTMKKKIQLLRRASALSGARI